MERIQYAPRQGVTFEPSLDVLIPALERLRACRDEMDVLVLTDQVPDIILPALAWVASQRTYIPHFAVETLVVCCGPLFLERCLGKSRSKELLRRYPKRAALAGLYPFDA